MPKVSPSRLLERAIRVVFSPSNLCTAYVPSNFDAKPLASKSSRF